MPEPTISTQNFVEVKEVKNGVIYLKEGGLRKILIVAGVNFDLKSEPEQTIILNGFQSFLNTLDFSVQFIIHSRKVNIDAYLDKMRARESQEENDLLKIQIGEYINFIHSFVEENAIINKEFFVIIPYEPTPLKSGIGGVFKALGLRKNETKKEDELDNKESLEQLTHRIDQVSAGLGQIGLRTVALEDEELIELYYNLYNPQLVEKKGLEIAKKQ